MGSEAPRRPLLSLRAPPRSTVVGAPFLPLTGPRADRMPQCRPGSRADPGAGRSSLGAATPTGLQAARARPRPCRTNARNPGRVCGALGGWRPGMSRLCAGQTPDGKQLAMCQAGQVAPPHGPAAAAAGTDILAGRENSLSLSFKTKTNKKTLFLCGKPFGQMTFLLCACSGERVPLELGSFLLR